MLTANALKASVLGIPFGTASARLRKKLVFHLAGKLGMLACFRCGVQIELLEQFSIEHTESWMRSASPVETFYDVEKIAFSHIACNVGAGLRPNKIYVTMEEQNKAAQKRYWSKPEKSEQHNERRRLKRASRRDGARGGTPVS